MLGVWCLQDDDNDGANASILFIERMVHTAIAVCDVLRLRNVVDVRIAGDHDGTSLGAFANDGLIRILLRRISPSDLIVIVGIIIGF